MCDACDMNNDPSSVACTACTTCRSAQYWEWEDGTQYDWMNWQANQPSDVNNEKCVRFRGDGKWYDSDCLRKNHFICKKGILTLVLAPLLNNLHLVFKRT